MNGRKAVVVGGGAVASRKVAGLIAARADVVVVAPKIVSDDLRARIAAHEAKWEARAYVTNDVDGAALVFAATDDSEVNRTVRDDAATRGVWANVADSPDLCDFDVPSSFQRDVLCGTTTHAHRFLASLQVAVFTGGASPAFAALMRRELEQRVTPSHLALFKLVVALRRLLPVAMRPSLSRIAAPEVLDEVTKRDRAALCGRLLREFGSTVSERDIDDLVSEALS
ncbi:MAG: hypothetical protein HYY84_20830 [Deltaproteobacteria bacterium]|nr:hypothetical protein [Deltaproteobacteria bacterium]